MKQIIVFIIFMMLLKCAGAQWEPGASVGTYKILNDSTRIYSQRTDGRGNELIIKNQSFLTGQRGVLTNRYRGLSYWKRSQMLNDSSFNVGDDTLTIKFPQTKILDRLCIYQENTEWITSVESGTGFNPNSSAFACAGSKSIEGTAVGNNDVMTLTAPGTPPDYSGYNYVTLEISSKGAWAQGQRIRLRFTNGSTLVGTSVNIGEGSSNFQSSIADSCQLLWIPITSFGNITGADGLRIVGAIQFTGTIGFFLDNICLVQTTTPVTPPVTEFQGWQSTLDVDPNLYHDNLTNANNTDWYIDSMERLTVHVTDQLRLIGDVESGREITQTWYINDNPFSYSYQGNATHVNNIYSPLFGSYLSAYPHPVLNGAMSFRASIHPNNDIVGADASFEFSASIANNDTTANNAIQPLQHQQINKPIFFVRGVNESTGFTDSMMEIYATGQQQWAHYGMGDFQTDTYSYLAAFNSNGVLVEVLPGDVGGGGGTETDPIALAKTITLNAGSGISITGTATQTLSSNPSWTIATTGAAATLKLGTLKKAPGDAPTMSTTKAAVLSNDTLYMQSAAGSSTGQSYAGVVDSVGQVFKGTKQFIDLLVAQTGINMFASQWLKINGVNVLSRDNSNGARMSTAGNRLTFINAATTTDLMSIEDVGWINMFNTSLVPASSLSGGIRLYSETAELKVRDGAGNVTTLSPHEWEHLRKPKNKLAWSYSSHNDDEWIEINMYKAMQTIEKQSKEIELLKEEIGKLKGKAYEKKRPVKLIYTGKVKK